jgi:hypothetical protein
MRIWIAAAAAALLAACGQSAQQSGPAGQAETPPVGDIQMASTENMPDWLLIARTGDGGYVHFNQRTIHRAADGIADVWVQVRYGQQQLYQTEDDTTETIVRYEVERVHYKFRCADENFSIAERQIMGPNEQVVGRENPPELWRAAPARGVARLVLPIACRGA